MKSDAILLWPNPYYSVSHQVYKGGKAGLVIVVFDVMKDVIDDVIDDVMDRIIALPAPAYSFLIITNHLGCGQPTYC